MMFITLSDTTGTTEIGLAGTVWEKYKEVANKGVPLIAKGRVDRAGEDGRLRIEHLEDCRTYRGRMTKDLELWLNYGETDEKLLEIKAALAAHAATSTKGASIRIAIKWPERGVVVWCKELPFRIKPSIELYDALEKVIGGPCPLRMPGTRPESLQEEIEKIEEVPRAEIPRQAKQARVSKWKRKEEGSPRKPAFKYE